MNKDTINNLDGKKGGMAAMTVVTAMQNLSKAEQVVGLATAFLNVLEEYEVHPADAFNVSARMSRDPLTNAGIRAEYFAVKMYVKNELSKRS